jgi:hypothetical protein
VSPYFKDAMASSERTMLMRKGGGYVALEEYVATVENRISAAALEGALEAGAYTRPLFSST